MLRPSQIGWHKTFMGNTHFIVVDTTTYQGAAGAFIPKVTALNAPAIMLSTFGINDDTPFRLGYDAKKVLYHEMIHAHQILKRGIPVPKDGTNYDSERPADYFNEPLEFDARIHEIAKDLNTTIEMLKNEVNRGHKLDDDVIEILLGNIPLDPKEFIKGLQQGARAWSGGGKNLWYHALPEKKKRMVSRLYKLHTYMLEYIAKHKA